MTDILWSSFPNVGSISTGDIIVGIRAGVNVRFTAPVYGSENVIVTTPTQAMASNIIYLTNDPSSLVTYTLPLLSNVGDRLSVVGQSSNGWIITQTTGQQIQVSASHTTLGATGTLASSNRYDSINLICIVANTIWTCLGSGQTAGFTIV